MINKSYPTSSLIISTYNWPEALECCLKSILRQSRMPNEVIIADDGSTRETRAVIERFQPLFPVPLIHVWQPDEGFQLARIRNKAIAKANYAYIIQIDSDLILHKRFVEDHLRLSSPGCFATGSRVILSEAYSKKLLDHRKGKASLFRWSSLNKNNGLRIPILTRLYKKHRAADIFYLRGCNMAFWRKDLMAVNGYNEEIQGWGREDNEIAARLINLGVSKMVVKHSAIVFHIYHKEKERNSVLTNNELLQKSISEKLITAPVGIQNHLQGS
ncbi:glycosyltransferase family 2 protein [Niabella sp.]|uniref:glycosyltransferase family 2 protein n=1 Tax=Niabella sp. TaxID=1962976 RepID=UPI002639D3CA|nr:glycosyltransferase family 2 protein [Niabella sp.]